MEREGQQGSEFVVKGRKRPAQNRMTSSTEEDTDDEIEVVNKKHDKVPLDNNDNEDEELEQPVFELKAENSEESEEVEIGNNDQLRVIATKIAKQAEVIRQKTGGVEGEIEEADEQEKTGGVEGDIEEADEQKKTGGVEGEIEVADEQERTGGVEDEMKEADEREEERKAAWNKGKEPYCNVDTIDYEVGYVIQ